MRPPVLILFALLLGCPSGTPPTQAEPVPTPEPTDDNDASALVGDWRSYAEPDQEPWASAPLDDTRWMQTSAELACIGRANHGDPDGHRVALRRVLAHHRTTAQAVMDYGIEVNQQAPRSLRLGARVANASQTCR